MSDHADIMLVDCARALAYWLHRDQDDLQGRPYIAHLQRVAERVEELGGEPSQVAAAWLHDAVEDGHAGHGTIRAIFSGTPVPRIIESLTRNKEVESYRRYISLLLVPGNERCWLVKLADLEDDMDRSRGPAPPYLTERYEWALPLIRARMATNKEAP